MTVEQFSSSDFVGANGLPFTEGAPGHRRWKEFMDVKWCMHNANPGVGTAASKVFVWHKNGVGYAVGKHAGNVASNEAVAADISWYDHCSSHWINHSMRGGGMMIDDTGVIKGSLDDTADIATS